MNQYQIIWPMQPRIKMKHPRHLIGRDTAESIQAGCSYGIGGLCDRIVYEMKRVYRVRPLVVATGGTACFMSKYCHTIQKIDPFLILEGILASYKNFQKKSWQKQDAG